MPIDENTDLLIHVASVGNAVEVERLISSSDPKALNSFALRLAAQHGHTQCVELLIPVSDPKAYNSWALQWAAQRGHTQCVKLLIPVSDPKAHNSAALRGAVENGHTQCMDVLYPISDPVVALKQLQQDHPNDYNKWGQLHEMVEAERLNEMLHNEVDGSLDTKFQRKM